MRRIATIVGLLTLLGIGCENRATDVGNPTISQPSQVGPTSPGAPSTPVPEVQSGPTVAELVGNFTASMPPAGSCSGAGCPSPTSTVPVCKSDPKAPKVIYPTANPRLVVLQNFFAYSENTKKLVAVYDPTIGVMTVSVTDAAIAMVCTGDVASSGDDVTIDFTCTLVDTPADQPCELSYVKVP